MLWVAHWGSFSAPSDPVAGGSLPPLPNPPPISALRPHCFFWQIERWFSITRESQFHAKSHELIGMSKMNTFDWTVYLQPSARTCMRRLVERSCQGSTNRCQSRLQWRSSAAARYPSNRIQRRIILLLGLAFRWDYRSKFGSEISQKVNSVFFAFERQLSPECGLGDRSAISWEQTSDWATCDPWKRRSERFATTFPNIDRFR